MFLSTRQSDSKGASQQRCRPRLEILEDRWCPAATNADFVSGVYQSVLHRTPAASELTPWVNQLAGGQTRAQVVQGIYFSLEGASNAVNDMYQQILLRQFDSGAAAFVNGFQNGTLTLQELKAQLMASDEYFQRFGESNNSLWVEAAFSDQFGRSADPAGTAAFAGSAGTQAGRVTAARNIINSQEGRDNETRVLYATYLNRNADSAGLGSNSAALATTAEQSVVVSFLASQEFFNRG